MENLILSTIDATNLIDSIARKTADLILARNPEINNDSASNQKDLLTRKETYTLLNISEATLWNYTKKGKLTSYGIGGRVYYKRSEILEAVKSLK